MPVVIFFWFCGYCWKRTGWLKVSQIDIDTGRREPNWEAINAYKAKVAAFPMWKRVFYWLF